MPSTAADPVSPRGLEPIHVVAGVVRHPRKKHKIFFSQRQNGQHLEGLWEFPGGKLEPGESRFHGLKRELQEELGIDVIAARPLHALSHQYKDKNIHLDVWEVQHYRGKPHGREGQQTRWLKPDEIADYQFPEADEPVLTALDLPSQLLITPEFSGQDEQQVLLHFSQLMKQRRYALVLFRSHQMSDKDYHQLAEKLREIAFLNTGDLIIHRPELKSLQQKRFASFGWRHLSASSLLAVDDQAFDDSVVLSASCHDEAELEQAQRLGCQFALLSTVRDTASHPGVAGKGWYGFSRLSKNTRLPLYALGGVERKDIALARHQGAIGVAGISDFWRL